ncbi:hypothetical protein COU76_03515 [Candidatus Peregrinibacteria bacterium CG10_big_fil_rev_8_21_14_0_10_49_10]|nr:MAG: hypothetical protein COU76_03515 [Candidatus Peregrinibacteria bacterium CG10_big_fil_rev_8_21_14_0_10_49_10]
MPSHSPSSEIQGPELLYHPRLAGTHPMPLLLSSQQEGVHERVNNVVVTGIAGNIGLMAAHELPRGGYNLRGTDVMFAPDFDPRKEDPNLAYNCIHHHLLNTQLLIQALLADESPGEFLYRALYPDLNLSRLGQAVDPSFDLTRYDTMLETASGNDVLIHLAFDPRFDNCQTVHSIDLKNVIMAINAYRAAMQAGVKRVVMASSVHRDDFAKRQSPRKRLYTTHTIPHPFCGYGHEKVMLEEVGKYCAQFGLEVICVCFGGVFYGNQPNSEEPTGNGVLTHPRDLGECLEHAITVDEVPGNYASGYCISRHNPQTHEAALLGWEPRYTDEDFNPRKPPFYGKQKLRRERNRRLWHQEQ